MNIYYISALVAASFWALSAIVVTQTVRYVGVLSMNRWRLIIATVSLWVIVLFQNTYLGLTDSNVLWLAFISGFVGIFIGDTALYASVNYLGSRRVGVLYALASPFTILFGFLFLSEVLSLQLILGCAIITLGIIIVITSPDKNKDSTVDMEKIQGNWKIGVLFGVLASVCQAIGIIVMRPIMETESADAIGLSALRMSFALVPMLFLRYFFPRTNMPLNAITWQWFARISCTALLGMVGGMTLLIFALKGGQAGIVSTLGSVTPIMVLPIVWWKTRKCPSISAWLGAMVVIVGTALLSIEL